MIAIATYSLTVFYAADNEFGVVCCLVKVIESLPFAKKKNERGNIMSRPTFEAFKTKALANSEVRKEYEALSVIYDLRKKLIELRKESGLTQEELAQLLKTKKSNISRLENVESHASPKLSTIAEYAKAMGHKVEINFVPIEFSS